MKLSPQQFLKPIENRNEVFMVSRAGKVPPYSSGSIVRGFVHRHHKRAEKILCETVGNKELDQRVKDSVRALLSVGFILKSVNSRRRNFEGYFWDPVGAAQALLSDALLLNSTPIRAKDLEPMELDFLIQILKENLYSEFIPMQMGAARLLGSLQHPPIATILFSITREPRYRQWDVQVRDEVELAIKNNSF
jgi:hypothetical protein